MSTKLSGIPAKLPESAGIATLKFDESACRPRRDGDVITLPKVLDAQFFPLKGGEQFLLRMGRGSLARPDQFSQVYFGGTDERPFLVQLERLAFENFIEGGEDGFYEALKPEPIARAERRWGCERTKRQGDIFAYQLPCTWKELARRHCENTRVPDWMYALGYEQDRSLFGTRHILAGWVLFYDAAGSMQPISSYQLDTVLSPERPVLDYSRILVGEGVVEASDHQPLFLEGPHLLAQTRLLFDSRNAD